MQDHKDRTHALLSASSSHRWLFCTPSAKLEEQFPDMESEAAKEGTLAHEIAEAKCRHYFFTADFSRRKLTARLKKLKENELYQSEMDGYTDDYLNFIKKIAMEFPSLPSVMIEEKVDFSDIAPGGFGTADLILINGRVLHVIDLKYGKGVPVQSEGNPQLALYAWGALKRVSMLYKVDTVRMSIAQPRLNNFSTYECSVSKLTDFANNAKEKASLAIEGKGEFCPDEEVCRFCRAKAVCRARSDKFTKLAFNIGDLPPLISAEEAGERLTCLAGVEKYAKALKDWALAECLRGGSVPGWKAVEGRGSRAFIDQDAAFAKLIESGYPEAVLYERKALTLAQAEKAVGKKEFNDIVGVMIETKAGAPALVPESDKRQAIQTKTTAEQAFND